MISNLKSSKCLSSNQNINVLNFQYCRSKRRKHTHSVEKISDYKEEGSQSSSLSDVSDNSEKLDTSTLDEFTIDIKPLNEYVDDRKRLNDELFKILDRKEMKKFMSKSVKVWKWNWIILFGFWTKHVRVTCRLLIYTFLQMSIELGVWLKLLQVKSKLHELQCTSITKCIPCELYSKNANIYKCYALNVWPKYVWWRLNFILAQPKSVFVLLFLLIICSK